MAAHPICSIPGCGKRHKGHGYCSLHLRRWKKTGDPNSARRYPPRGEPWQYMLDHMWDDCPKWPYARGKGGYGHIQHEGVVKDIHRVVCEMVHGPAPAPDMDAAHNCGKGGESCFGAKCIEWKTKADNQADRVDHGTSLRGDAVPGSKLTRVKVIQIRSLKGRMTHREIAERYGVERSTITDIINRKSWTWLS